MSISKLIALVPVAALAVACGGGSEAAPEAAAPEFGWSKGQCREAAIPGITAERL
jgi:hypothetical protein